MKHRFRCLGCGRRFETACARLDTGCLLCGHPYCKWLNYEQWLKSRDRSARYRKVMGI